MTTQDHRTGDWRALGKRRSNRGRWGADDQLAARNLITADRIGATSALVRRARTSSVSRPSPRESSAAACCSTWPPTSRSTGSPPTM